MRKTEFVEERRDEDSGMEEEFKHESEYEEKKERKMIVPGEVAATGQNFLPGENTKRDGKDIIATRFGLLDVDDRLIKVIPLSGTYLPRRGNVIIGKVVDITYNGWLIDIDSPYSAFLPIIECKGFISKKDDLSLVYNYGEMVIAKVIGVKGKGVDLTTRERGFHKIEEGIIVRINSNKVPRVIGKQGSMINLIKEYTGCNIVVGQNGIVWIRGESIESELLAKEAIKMITERSFIDGLTDKVKEFLEQNKKA